MNRALRDEKRVLDVSRLEPPEPLLRILAALDTLAAGEYLRVRHRREPFPLYTILAESGYAWHTRRHAADDYELLIWREQDASACAAVQAWLRGDPRPPS